MRKYRSLIVIPCVIIAISSYLIGLNYLRRVDRVDSVRDAVPVSAGTYEPGGDTQKKTEAEEDAELKTINDKININTATVEELIKLDGIGEVLANRIIEKRTELGGFVSIEQLLSVKGIGNGIFKNIKDYICTE